MSRLHYHSKKKTDKMLAGHHHLRCQAFFADFFTYGFHGTVVLLLVKADPDPAIKSNRQ